MFKKYMDLAKINKIIAKQRKLAEQYPDTGYSAIISAICENEAKGTFKSYPAYTHNVISNFFVEAVAKLRQAPSFQKICKENNMPVEEVPDGSVVYIAVLAQAFLSGNLSEQEAQEYETDIDNGIKVLVNMKLLPERCLNDCEFDMRVA